MSRLWSLNINGADHMFIKQLTFINAAFVSYFRQNQIFYDKQL